MANALGEIERQGIGRNERSVQQLGIQVGDYGFGTERRAIFRDGPNCASALDDDFPNGLTKVNLHAAGRGRLGHRLGDGTHPTDRVPPGSFLPVHFPEDVVQ